MARQRTILAVAVSVVLASALTAWTVREFSVERGRVEDVLRSEAALLARTLAPALAAASSAARELDEIVAWKLLDNARLLARLEGAGALRGEALEEIREILDLDLIAILDPAGRPVRVARIQAVPAPGGAGADPRLRALLDGRATEVVLGWTEDATGDHAEAAAARAGGGAVLVRTDATTAYAFARRLGVASLLESTVGVGGVLYLALEEVPGGVTWATWDSLDLPPPAAFGESVRAVRKRRAFEVSLDVPMPAGRQASLRVGLDAAPLTRAAGMVMRRSILMGAILAAFGLAAAAFAVVSHARSQERAEGARRLAALEEARRRSERLAVAGSLAAGLAHEVRNPLNTIAMAAQRIERRDGADGTCRSFAGGIRAEVRRLEEILKGFLDLARPVTGTRQSEELGSLAKEVAALMEAEASSGGIRLRVETVSGEVRADVDREALRRALINLVRNALQASSRGDTVILAVERAANGVRLRVIDEGRGVAPEMSERAFEPFVTSRADGTGLGLALVRRVVEEHGGRVRLAGREGGGAEVVVDLGGAGEAAA